MSGEKPRSSASSVEIPSENEILSEAWAFLEQQAAPRPTSGRVYHYTSFEGLQAIDSSKLLHATGIRQLNDSSEFFHGFDLALSEAVVRSNDPSDPGIANLWSQYVSIHLLPPLGPRTRSVLAMRATDCFVTCFSEDDNSLSQWRAYCPDGGAAIGFNIQDILDTSAPATATRTQSGVRISPLFARCEYVEAAQKQVVSQLMAATEREFLAQCRSRDVNAAILRPGTDASWYIVVASHARFNSSLSAISPLLKHSAFKDECEWRLVVSQRDGMQFRSGRRGIASYICLPLPPIGQLTIGPCPDPGGTTNTVAAMFPGHRSNIGPFRTAYCNIPYRG